MQWCEADRRHPGRRRRLRRMRDEKPRRTETARRRRARCALAARRRQRGVARPRGREREAARCRPPRDAGAATTTRYQRLESLMILLAETTPLSTSFPPTTIDTVPVTESMSRIAFPPTSVTLS